MSSPAFPKSE